jgi:hypothetical protein
MVNVGRTGTVCPVLKPIWQRDSVLKKSIIIIYRFIFA